MRREKVDIMVATREIADDMFAYCRRFCLMSLEKERVVNRNDES